MKYHPADHQQAANAILENGFVILKDAVPHKPLEILRERMDQDSEELLAYCEKIGGNPRERGHLQQGPPLSKEFVFPEVAMNEHVNEICSRLFRHKPKLTFYNGNTNYPGSTTQQLHMDGQHHTKPPEPVHAPISVVVNIPPQPTHSGNGAIQIWPGSHTVRKNIGGRIDTEYQIARRKLVPPIQVRTELGDVLIRDVRLWHRGVPNPSNRARHMVALIVTSGAVEHKARLTFERGCESALEGHSVDANANYEEGPIEYLLGPTERIYRALMRSLDKKKD